MKPFYTSAIVLFAACSLWIAADAPHGNRHAANQYDVGFSSLGMPRH